MFILEKWFVIAIVVVIIASCAPAATPTPVPPTATATAIPPTETSIPTLAPTPRSTTGMVSVKALRSDTKNPIVGAKITLSSDSDKWEETTDAQGNYDFGSIKPGNYKIGFSLAFEGENNLPCDRFEWHLPDVASPWLTFTSTRNDGVISFHAFSTGDVTIKAGDALQLEIRIGCP